MLEGERNSNMRPNKFPAANARFAIQISKDITVDPPVDTQIYATNIFTIS